MSGGNGKPRPDKRTAQTIDGVTGQPDPTPTPRRRIDLSTLRDVRLEMAAVYRRMDAKEIESQEATRRVYVLRSIADVIELADLEKRIQDLEERQAAALPGHRPLPARTLN